jgi:hypothetical protein
VAVGRISIRTKVALGIVEAFFGARAEGYMKLAGIGCCTVTVSLVLAFSTVGVSDAASAETRYFRVCPDPAPGVCGSLNDFVIALQDPNQLQTADDILSGKIVDKVHVAGEIVAGPVPYNSPWRFYLNSKTITFFTLGHATCWGYSTVEINANLDRVGTPGFLPTRFWCPRGYRVSKEVQAK